MDAVSHQTLPKAVDMSVPVAMADGKHAFEAVVTASDGRISSKGADINMASQKKDKLHDVESCGLWGMVWTVWTV